MTNFKNKGTHVYTYFTGDFQKVTEDEILGTCPLCGKEGHFYVNTVKAAFSCKKCHAEGGMHDFLRLIYVRIKEQTTERDLLRFTKQKGIPLPTLKTCGMAYHNGKYFLPAWSPTKNITDLRQRSLTKKEQSLKGTTAGVVGAHELTQAGGKVYVTEGYTDYLALKWLLQRVGAGGEVVSFPGVNVCKPEWAQMFVNYDVVLCFDVGPEAEGTYDPQTGKLSGSYKAAHILGQACRSVSYLVWDDDLKLPKGYDVRTLVLAGKKEPSKLWKKFSGLIKPKHIHFYRKQQVEGTSVTTRERDNSVTAARIIEKTEEHTELNDNYRDAFKIALGTCISQNLPGSDNVFTLIVGPVASGKTLITSAFEKSNRVIYESTLTSTGLVSGWGLGGASVNTVDPSVCAKVNNNALVLKDLTEVFSNPVEANQVFSILRGAYDGVVNRQFGNGKRSYKTNMSFLGGVTHAIRMYDDNHLGNRFLMYELEIEEGSEEAIQESALNRALFGAQSTSDVQLMVDDFLNRDWNLEPAKLIAKLPNWFRQKLKPLCRLAALLKSKVQRVQYGYQAGRIAAKHSDETGNRIVVQLEKLGLCLGLIDDKQFLDEEIYALLYKIAFDTVDCFQTDLIKLLLSYEAPLSLENIQALCNIPNVLDVIQDALYLKLIEEIHSRQPLYQPHKRIKDLWKRSKL